MNLPKTVFLDAGSLGEDIDLTPIRSLPVDCICHQNTSPSQTVSRIRDAEIIITNKVLLDERVLVRASKLKLVCVAATGMNNVDLKAAEKLNISVKNVVDYATPSVVQHVFMLILSLSGRLLETRNNIRQGQWQRSPFFCLLNAPFSELQGKTLGIIGYGVLGKAVARVAESFGMIVQIADIPGRPKKEGRVSFDQLLRTSDVLSLHCPLTEQTRSLIDATALKKMKKTAILINTARGGVVDEESLLESLESQLLGGAGIDVTRMEPPGSSCCLLSADLPNLLVTPHVAWASHESRQRLVTKLAENIRMYFS